LPSSSPSANATVLPRAAASGVTVVPLPITAPNLKVAGLDAGRRLPAAHRPRAAPAETVVAAPLVEVVVALPPAEAVEAAEELDPPA